MVQPQEQQQQQHTASHQSHHVGETDEAVMMPTSRSEMQAASDDVLSMKKHRHDEGDGDGDIESASRGQHQHPDRPGGDDGVNSSKDDTGVNSMDETMPEQSIPIGHVDGAEIEKESSATTKTAKAARSSAILTKEALKQLEDDAENDVGQDYAGAVQEQHKQEATESDANDRNDDDADSANGEGGRLPCSEHEGSEGSSSRSNSFSSAAMRAKRSATA